MPAESSILNRLLKNGVVAVLRAPSGEMLADVAAALLAAGVEGIEVTFTVPRAHQILEEVAARFGDKIVLGAGTVLDPETARVAILSGAKFIVSPTVNPRVIEMCRRYSRVSVPGALTPTEILTAWEAGADIVKIFPSELTGPSYLKTVAGPLPQVRMMPSGGVTLANAADFLKAGACALSIGSSMVDPQAIANRQFDKITELARKYVDIVRQHRAL